MANKIAYLTEDEVRDGYTDKDGFHKGAKQILEFDKSEAEVKQGTGQLTTFKKLGFKGTGSNHKPDGWYLPNDCGNTAIILETKSSDKSVENTSYINELLNNVKIANSKYSTVIGILYNGIECKVFVNEEEKKDIPTELQNKDFYKNYCLDSGIDKHLIYNLTSKINNCLHKKFGIKNLHHRMIFTACALVAKRYGALLCEGMDYATFHTAIHSTLAKSLANDKRQNQKIGLLLEVYSEIKMNTNENQEAIDDFIKWVSEISECINSNSWRGEDVMGIFFNEFNRYKKKSESGQVFTPEHITSFMYRIIDVHQTDYVLDAACGSGGFLVKAMSMMMHESGGTETKRATKIKREQLFGIEFDRELYALACANMLIHKDGKTNLEHLDSRTITAGEWIKSKPITKVLMNPPFETTYGCLEIVKNVLDNVAVHTECAFILPDKKLETDRSKGKSIIKNHCLKKIIKLPEKTFNEGVTTSIFVFEAGVPQGDKEIFGCYIKEDGLETVKNQGRHDVKGRWPAIEDKWIDIIHKQAGDSTVQWISPKEHLSYQIPIEETVLCEEDFLGTALDYVMFNQGIDTDELYDSLLSATLMKIAVGKGGIWNNGDNEKR